MKLETKFNINDNIKMGEHKYVVTGYEWTINFGLRYILSYFKDGKVSFEVMTESEINLYKEQ